MLVKATGLRDSNVDRTVVVLCWFVCIEEVALTSDVFGIKVRDEVVEVVVAGDWVVAQFPVGIDRAVEVAQGIPDGYSASESNEGSSCEAVAVGAFGRDGVAVGVDTGDGDVHLVVCPVSNTVPRAVRAPIFFGAIITREVATRGPRCVETSGDEPPGELGRNDIRERDWVGERCLSFGASVVENRDVPAVVSAEFGVAGDGVHAFGELLEHDAVVWI